MDCIHQIYGCVSGRSDTFLLRCYVSINFNGAWSLEIINLGDYNIFGAKCICGDDIIRNGLITLTEQCLYVRKLFAEVSLKILNLPGRLARIETETFHLTVSQWAIVILQGRFPSNAIKISRRNEVKRLTNADVSLGSMQIPSKIETISLSTEQELLAFREFTSNLSGRGIKGKYPPTKSIECTSVNPRQMQDGDTIYWVAADGNGMIEMSYDYLSQKCCLSMKALAFVKGSSLNELFIDFLLNEEDGYLHEFGGIFTGIFARFDGHFWEVISIDENESTAQLQQSVEIETIARRQRGVDINAGVQVRGTRWKRLTIVKTVQEVSDHSYE